RDLLLELRDDLLGRDATTTPTNLRHDAEAALIIAAVLNLEQRTRAPRRGRSRMRPLARTHASSQRLDRDQLASIPRLRDRLQPIEQRDPLLLTIAEHRSELGHRRELLGLRVRVTTRDHQPRARVLAPRSTDRRA